MFLHCIAAFDTLSYKTLSSDFLRVNKVLVGSEGLLVHQVLQ